MRTALVLLFLLAVASVPGSLLPQRPLNPVKVQGYLAAHGAWGSFLDHLGMFDVFGTPWFGAIYLLLFVSLVGCLVPRIRMHARAMIAKPLPAPRNLDRLPESGALRSAAAPVAVAVAAREALGRRWRVVRRDEPTGAITLSAEKGYSRETGNLIFHVALLAALVLIAVGRLYSYQGMRIVVQGADGGFCNVVAQYDSWRPGRFAQDGRISPAPFCLDSLDQFTAEYLPTGEPSKFRADVTYSRTVHSPPQKATLTVNHPLRIEGDRVYLIGHGFAPQVTVRVPDGRTRQITMPFVPTDPSTLLSEGAFKEYGKPDAKQDLGVEGFFAPTPQDKGNGVITSVSPQVSNPVLGIFVYTGTLNATGAPQSVYSLNTSAMTRIGQANLRIGETRTFAGGVSVRFDGWLPWASIQVSHDPTQGWLLIAAVAMVTGLIGSLGIRRRRLWLRITPDASDDPRSPTVVSVGGLARSDAGNFTAEFAVLLERLRQALPTTPALVPAGRE
ncbi:MAG: cytochrome c biogenesis protein ResB [Actinomycetota bacterium]